MIFTHGGIYKFCGDAGVSIHQEPGYSNVFLSNLSGLLGLSNSESFRFVYRSGWTGNIE